LSLPEPTANTLSIGALRHVGWDVESSETGFNTIMVDSEDSHLVLIDIASVALVCNGKTTSTELLILERSTSMHRWSVGWARVIIARISSPHAGEFAVASEFESSLSACWELEYRTGLLIDIAVEPPPVEIHIGERSRKFMTIACVSSIDRLVEKADMAKNSCWEHSEGKEGKRLHSFKESKLIKYSQ
jgi:hypothetical protein